MRRLIVQIQPTLIANGSEHELIARLQAAADGVALEFRGEDRGDDGGAYINLSFVATDHIVGWSRLRQLYDSSDMGGQLAHSTIVVCEGDHGWDDYLLLHHFDPGERQTPLGKKSPARGS